MTINFFKNFRKIRSVYCTLLENAPKAKLKVLNALTEVPFRIGLKELEKLKEKLKLTFIHLEIYFCKPFRLEDMFLLKINLLKIQNKL